MGRSIVEEFVRGREAERREQEQVASLLATPALRVSSVAGPTLEPGAVLVSGQPEFFRGSKGATGTYAVSSLDDHTHTGPIEEGGATEAYVGQAAERPQSVDVRFDEHGQIARLIVRDDVSETSLTEEQRAAKLRWYVDDTSELKENPEPKLIRASELGLLEQEARNNLLDAFRATYLNRLIGESDEDLRLRLRAQGVRPPFMDDVRRIIPDRYPPMNSQQRQNLVQDFSDWVTETLTQRLSQDLMISREDVSLILREVLQLAEKRVTLRQQETCDCPLCQRDRASEVRRYRPGSDTPQW